MRNRILEFLKYKGGTPYRFIRDCALQPSFFHGKSSGISARTMAKIEALYPDPNPNWVSTGRGAMLRGEGEAVPYSEHLAIIQAREAEIERLKNRVAELEAVISAVGKALAK